MRESEPHLADGLGRDAVPSQVLVHLINRAGLGLLGGIGGKSQRQAVCEVSAISIRATLVELPVASESIWMHSHALQLGPHPDVVIGHNSLVLDLITRRKKDEQRARRARSAGSFKLGSQAFSPLHPLLMTHLKAQRARRQQPPQIEAIALGGGERGTLRKRRIGEGGQAQVTKKDVLWLCCTVSDALRALSGATLPGEAFNPPSHVLHRLFTVTPSPCCTTDRGAGQCRSCAR